MALLVAILLGALLATLALIDRGALDGPIERRASSALDRGVHFDRLRTHLLSRHPRIWIGGLTIANPAWLRGGIVATAASIRVDLQLGALLRGRLVPIAIAIDRPVLRLVRLGPNYNNWSISRHPGSGPAFAPLATVRSFTVSNGVLQLRDYARGLRLRGPFSIDSGPRPFHFAGAGILRGGAIRFVAQGGPLHGAAVGPAYPFAARIVDGATILSAQGLSVQPFDLTQYRLAIGAAGPNLADLGYLFNLVTPNSAPFRLTTLTSSDGRHLRFDRLAIRTGASAITGAIWSDHGTPRRDIFARFHASRLDRSDIDAMLASIPSRAAARVQSGAVKALAPSRWLLSDAPFGLQRLRATDLDFRVAADRLTGYALPLAGLQTRIDLDHGLLDIPYFRASLYAGTVAGKARVDAREAIVKVATSGTLGDLHLAEIGSLAGTQQGRASLAFDLAGTGNSLHAAAGTASGTLSARVDGAILPRSAAWMAAGDLLRAAGASIGKGGAGVALDCAEAHLSGSGGKMMVGSMAVATPLGTASGVGYVDLGTERLDLTVTGAPAHRRLFQVAAPVRVSGSWLHPAVAVLPGRKASALGLHGILGVALTPLAGLLPVHAAAASPASCR